MITWILVGAGGALGAMARHALNHFAHQRTFSSVFPLGIFVVNIAGSVVIGVLAGLMASGRWHWSIQARTFVIVGVLGGFTTFSSFSLDTLALFRDGHHGLALWNVAGQVGFSLIGVWAGFRIGSFA
jgi:CrcB protein